MIYLLKQICMGSFAITSSFASLLFFCGLPGLVVVFIECSGARGFVVMFSYLCHRGGALFDERRGLR